MASIDTDQLEGSTSTSGVSNCEPLEYNGTLVLHPCGLVANTLFNDIIELTSGATMDEEGIAWKSDVEDKVGTVRCFALPYRSAALTLKGAAERENYLG